MIFYFGIYFRIINYMNGIRYSIHYKVDNYYSFYKLYKLCSLYKLYKYYM